MTPTRDAEARADSESKDTDPTENIGERRNAPRPLSWRLRRRRDSAGRGDTTTRADVRGDRDPHDTPSIETGNDHGLLDDCPINLRTDRVRPRIYFERSPLCPSVHEHPIDPRGRVRTITSIGPAYVNRKRRNALGDLRKPRDAFLPEPRRACVLSARHELGTCAYQLPWSLSSVDPHRLDDAAAAILFDALFDTLYARTESGAFTASLAEAEPEPDGKYLRVRS